MNITKLYKNLVPNSFKKGIYNLFLGKFLEYRRNYKIIKPVIQYYNSAPDISENERPYVDYMRKHRYFLSNKKVLFLSSFVQKYEKIKPKVYQCPQRGIYYVMHKGKKLFWKRGVDPLMVSRAYLLLLTEQDQLSPHLYWENELTYPGKILFDIGAAEGLITLDKIELLQHTYLFECELDWIEALYATFEPYKDKVTIIEKYITSETNEAENTITIDDFVSQSAIQPNLIKMDIEGFEEKALSGAKQTIVQSNDLQIAVCTYHLPDAENNIRFFLKNVGCKCQTSNGYMFFKHDKRTPFLRHGLIRAIKQ